MKTKHFIYLLFMTLALSFNACSSDGGDGDGNGSGNGNGNGNGSGDEVTSISIEISSSTECGIYPGDTVSFSVRGNNNVDLTSQSSITVNGNAVSGNSYTTTDSENLEVTASYQSLLSNMLQVNVAEDTPRFTKNVLIEDYTGTWCGYCPRVSYAIELVKEETDQVSVVAIHNDSEFYCGEVTDLENAFGVSAYPTVRLNRSGDWTFPEPNNVAQVVGLTACDNATVGLALSPSISGNNITVDVNVKFGNDFSFDNTRLTVFILEDDLIADQENYTSYYGGVSVIPNFEHDHVLRASLTNVSGDGISSNDVTNSEYSRSFSLAVPSNVADASKLSIVAFVSNDDFSGSASVINSRMAYFGDSQDFEEH